MFKYLLFVVLINADGTEQMHTISNTKLECLVEKAEHKDVEGTMLFFCGKDTEHFNKEQKLY